MDLFDKAEPVEKSKINTEGLIPAETGDTTFYIKPELHNTKTEIDADIGCFDGVIIENGITSLEEFRLSDITLDFNSESLIRGVCRHGLPIFAIDLSTERSNFPSYEHHIYWHLTALVGLFVLMSGALWGVFLLLPKVAEYLGKSDSNLILILSSYFQLSHLFSTAGMRSALWAQKAENKINPEVKKENPQILMIQGSNHNDTKFYFEHPFLRLIVINFHRLFNYWYWSEQYIGKYKIIYRSQSGDRTLKQSISQYQEEIRT